MFKISCLVLIVLFAVIQDLYLYKIKNQLIVIGLIVGVLFLLSDGGGEVVAIHLLGMLLPLVLLFPLFALRMLGAGDIKLFSVIGLFLGPSLGLSVMLFSAFFGAIQALCALCKNRNFKERFLYFFQFINRKRTYSSYNYYCASEDNYKNAIHFSISIFLALGVCVMAL